MGSGAEGGESEDDLLADAAELAASEWGIHPRDFWDTTPNVSDTPDRDLGITTRLLTGLIDGYMRRRRRELMQLAIAIRAAQQEKPQQVQEAIAKAAPLPQPPIEYDEFGDPVRNGMVVGFWDRIYKNTA